MIFTAAYIISIVLVNWGFEYVPLLQTPWGDMWPPMSIVVGFVFVLRDFSQREIGHGVLAAMLVGAGLSYIMASPIVAIASLVAFASSELMDWLFYSYTKRPFHDRIIISSLVSCPIDSGIFLYMIGHFSLSAVILMTLSKLVAALIMWKMVPVKRNWNRAT